MATGSTKAPGEIPRPWHDRRVIAAGLVVFALGWFAGQGRNPLAPPKPDRPVLTALARLAKLGLWVLVAEPVPEDPRPEQLVIVSRTDRLNHREGW